MILSHEHQFIFVKTHKTAGTSIEVALAKVAGPDAICTAIGSVPEATGQGPVRGLFNPIGEMRTGSVRNGARTLRQLVKRRRYYNHMEARQIKSRIRPIGWEDMFTFCFERNPWDKSYSMYRFLVRVGRYSGSFDEFLFDPAAPLSDWHLYTIRDHIIVDRVFRFENLSSDFAEACATVGVEAPDLGVEKDGGLPADAYKSAYDKRMIERVATVFSREIETFGYEF